MELYELIFADSPLCTITVTHKRLCTAPESNKDLHMQYP